MNIVNGYLFSSTDFKFPLSLTMVHAVIGFVLSYAVIHIQCEGCPIENVYIEKTWRNLAVLTLQGVLFALNVCFNNMSLMFINVTLNQIVKASNPVVTAILCMIIMRRRYSLKYWFGLLAIVSGVIMSVYGNPRFDSFGFFLVCSSVLMASCMVVVSEKIMSDMKLNAITFLMNTAPQIAISILPFAIGREISSIIQFAHENLWRLLFILIMTGCMAFLYNISHYALIKLTGSVYSTVMGNFKIAVLIILSEIIFYDPEKRLTLLNQIGVVFTVASFSALSWIKHKERSEEVARQLEYQRTFEELENLNVFTDEDDEFNQASSTTNETSIEAMLNGSNLSAADENEEDRPFIPPEEHKRRNSISEIAMGYKGLSSSNWLREQLGDQHDTSTNKNNFVIDSVDQDEEQ